MANIHIEPGNAMDGANARLIVAAPDLLAALKALANTIEPIYRDTHQDQRDAHAVALAAIAKAGGA